MAKKTFQQKYANLQQKVNALASFVEACEELDVEPFFSPDDKTTVRGVSGTKWTFELGDRFHFRSALITFRRLLMPSELPYWRDVIEILHELQPVREKSHLQQEADLIEQCLGYKAPFGKLDVGRERMVNLWLNTVFAHDGLDGPNKREEFEKIVDTCGHGIFEYNFRLTVKQLVERFQEISKKSARPTLQFLAETQHIKHTFRIGAAFGKLRREQTPEGHTIIRQGSSEFYTEEKLEDRLTRILERTNNSQMRSVFENLDPSKSITLRAILAANSFRECVQLAGGTLKIETAINGKVSYLPDKVRTFFNVSDGRQSHPLTISLECYFVTTAEGEKALDIFLSKLKRLLLQT